MAADSKLVVLLKLDGTELGKGITRAQKDVATLGVAFSGVGLAAAAAVKMAATFQDTTIKAARAAGMASQQFSALAYAAGLSGVSTEMLGKSMVKLQNPTGIVNQTLIDLGIAAKDSSGKVKDQTTLMGELADKFEKIQDPAIKSQAAFRIFGEEGVKMVSLLESGKKGLSDMAKEAEAFGQTVSEKAGKNAELFNDNLTKAEKGIAGFRNVLSESAIELANNSGVMDIINGKLKDLIAWWRGLEQGTKETTIKIIAAVAAFGGLLLVFSALAAALPALSAGFTLMTGPVGLVIAGLGLLTAGVSEYKAASAKGTEAQLQFIATTGPMGASIKGISDLYDILTAKALGSALSMRAANDALRMTLQTAERNIPKSKPIKVKLTDTVKPAEVMFKSETLEAINDIKRARYASSGANVEQMERLNKMLAKQDKAYYDSGQQAIIAYAKVAESIAKTAQAVIKPFGDLTSAIADGIMYDAEVASRDLDVVSNRATEAYNAQKSALEEAEAAKIAALAESFDSQIRQLEDNEARKYDILERGANERLLLLDNEYQKARDAAQAAFEAQLEQDKANYEAKQAELDAESLDREQKKLTETIMEEDARLLKEQREKDHESVMAQIAKDYADKKKGVDDDLKAAEKLNAETNKAQIEALTQAKNDALSKAEEDKNAKMKDLDIKRAAEEKAIEKQRLETQYNAQMDAFNATKAVKIAETIASGAAAAAQAFSSMTAAMPWGLGEVLGGIVAGTILTTTAMRVGQISSQAPIKPAGLLEDGGFIGGTGTHANGGDYNAKVESGEFYLDRSRTSKMLKAIDSGLGAGGGGIQITFQAGAIQGDIRDERTMNTLAVRLGNLIQRQMVTA